MKHRFAITLFVLFPLTVFGQSFNGRFSTSFYSWERNLTDALSQNHLRLYQTAQVTFGQLANNRLSFHFYGQASQDISESADADPVPRLYSAYLQWVERKGVLRRLKLGRQRVYSGVAYGTIDGVDLSLRLAKRWKVGGFVGLLVPFSNEVEVASWDDSHAFGARVGSDDLLGARVLVSFVQRNRRPSSYAVPGRFTQKRLRFESLEQRLVGVDVLRRFAGKLGVYGRLDYDIEQERVRRGQVELTVSPSSRLDLSAEFFHRAPLVEANSIFSVFDQSTTQDVSLRAIYRVGRDWSVNGSFGFIKYDGDESVRFGVGVRGKYGYLGYNFRRGYGGQNNGVTASVNYPLGAKLGLIASTGLARYRLFDETMPDNTSLTGSVGFNYRPSKYFSVDFLGQGVRNRFYDDDFRLFVKANYWTFGRFGK
ncbi:MAG: hypothetical protein D6743_18290 [Calditrichaeota bacterium]|nr:MAG: hypothetical protein D6743_18290 [Calditrichota bacterium]